MLFAAIVEDEQEVADLIAGYLQKFGEENQIEIAYESFQNGIEFLEHYSPKFDIVFMDIQMPGIDGMQTAKELREVDKSVSLVFITNMAQFAIKGYEVDAVDFAVKPLSYFQFATKLKRVIGIVRRNRQSVCIKTEESLIALPVNNIFYVEVIQHTVIYHTSDGNYQVKNTTMKQAEEYLSRFGFSRCNYCYLVNLHYVSKVDGMTVTVMDEVLQISRSRKKEFIAELTKYVGQIGKGWGGCKVMAEFWYYLHSGGISFWIYLFIAEMLFFSCYKRRSKFLLRFIPSVIAAFAAADLLQRYATWHLMVGFFTFYPGIMFVISIVLLWFCFDLKFSEALFYAIAAYGAQNCIFNMNIVMNLLLRWEIDWTIRYLYNDLLALVVFVLFFFVLVRRIKRGEKIGVSNYKVIVFSAIAISLIYVLNAWVQSYSYNIPTFCFCTLICILLLIIQFGMFDRNKAQIENETLRHILKEEDEQRKTIEANIDYIKVRCHDLKHQIAALRHETSQKERNDGLRSLERSVMLYDSIAQTGNHALDVVLTEKGIICEQNEIKLSIIADGNALGFMNVEDIYVLFGNAFSNAIENLLKVEDRDKRFISLKLSKTGDIVGIHMENYLETRPEFVNGLPQTTKKDKELHGYGMRSIRYIVEKYGGSLEIQTERNVFALGIMFPLKA